MRDVEVEVIALSAEVLAAKSLSGASTIGALRQPLQQDRWTLGLLRFVFRDRQLEDDETLDSILSEYGLAYDAKPKLAFQAVFAPYLSLECQVRGSTMYSQSECHVKIGPPSTDFFQRLDSTTATHSDEKHCFLDNDEKSSSWVLELLCEEGYAKALKESPAAAEDVMELLLSARRAARVLTKLESSVCMLGSVTKKQ